MLDCWPKAFLKVELGHIVYVVSVWETRIHTLSSCKKRTLFLAEDGLKEKRFTSHLSDIVGE